MGVGEEEEKECGDEGKHAVGFMKWGRRQCEMPMVTFCQKG